MRSSCSPEYLRSKAALAVEAFRTCSLLSPCLIENLTRKGVHGSTGSEGRTQRTTVKTSLSVKVSGREAGGGWRPLTLKEPKSILIKILKVSCLMASRC
jgi:hypothetical protein